MKQSNPTKNQSGYIALISAIIISFVLLTVLADTGNRGYSARFNIFNRELKAMSAALAGACVETAKLKLAENPNYAPPAPAWVRVGEGGCEISRVTTAGGAGDGSFFTIHVRATNTPIATHTALQVTVGPPPDLIVRSWQEIP